MQTLAAVLLQLKPGQADRQTRPGVARGAGGTGGPRQRHGQNAAFRQGLALLGDLVTRLATHTPHTYQFDEDIDNSVIRNAPFKRKKVSAVYVYFLAKTKLDVTVKAIKS